MKQFLHVGCGPKDKTQTTRGFNSDAWREIRLDIDETVSPDLVGTMTDMGSVPSNSMDAIFSAHNIEHLYAHEVPLALAEFLRVLKPEGFLVVTCPDLQSVCALVAEDKLSDPAFMTEGGPIAPIDILYGYRPALTQGNIHMAHRYGFTAKTLVAHLQTAGFMAIASIRRAYPYFDLWAIASKPHRSEQLLRILAQQHFPKASKNS